MSESDEAPPQAVARAQEIALQQERMETVEREKRVKAREALTVIENGLRGLVWALRYFPDRAGPQIEIVRAALDADRTKIEQGAPFVLKRLQMADRHLVTLSKAAATADADERFDLVWQVEYALDY